MKTNKFRLISLIIVVVLLLCTPLIGMQFSNEVNWSLTDFIMAAILLFGTVFVIEMILRKTPEKPKQRLYILMVIASLLLIWLELAVGIFGSPIAGN